MNFELADEYKDIQKVIRDFTESKIQPIAAETDRTGEYPAATIEELFNLGIMGINIPEEFGGAGMDALASTLCIEEISKACASTGDIVATHNGLCCEPIFIHGTEEQKKKYLPMLTSAIRSVLLL